MVAVDVVPGSGLVVPPVFLVGNGVGSFRVLDRA